MLPGTGGVPPPELPPLGALDGGAGYCSPSAPYIVVKHQP